MKRTILVVLIGLFCFLLVPLGGIQAQYANDCSCLGNGNCSDSGPGGGYCFTGEVLACGNQCPPGYKNVEMMCSNAIPQSCGGKCVLEQSCVTGFCQGGTCKDVDGDFLCGSGGCGPCSRFVRETICGVPGSQCQVWCSADETCGAGCGGGGGTIDDGKQTIDDGQ